MGKVLGGGSSINGMMWIRGHKEDWDFYASETGDPAWSYDSVLPVYRRIESWHGAPDPNRGIDGPVYVEPAANVNGGSPLLVRAAALLDIPTFDSPNGRMMELGAGAANMDVIIRDHKRQSIYRSYITPFSNRSNLTILTDAMVTRLIFDGKRATGVDVAWHGDVHRIAADKEIVVSLGAINTPKLLFQSGIGDQDDLRRFGLPVVQHLPGLGHNFQDHVLMFGVVWELHESPIVPNAARAVLQFASDGRLTAPDVQILQSGGGSVQHQMKKLGLSPEAWWSLAPGVVRPESRGRLHFMGPDPKDNVEIEANHLSHPDDMRAAIAGVELCRELGRSDAVRRQIKRELLPGEANGSDLRQFVREQAVTYWHQSCTAKMGRDEMSVVDGSLRVYGVDGLRVADASVLPRITTGNTMAPCVVIGERAGDLLQQAHQL